MALTLGQAAKQAGLSKPTLSKHVRLGRLSARKGDDGVYQIEEAELGRFMSSYQRGEVTAAATVLPPAAGLSTAASVASAVELAVMQERARQLEERLAETTDRLTKAEARAEAAEAKADEAVARVMGLLEGPQSRAGWWSRILGR